MLSEREIELLGKIEILTQRIAELEARNSSKATNKVAHKVQIASNKNLDDRGRFIKNFIIAASFPIISGMFRIIYKKIYGLKK